MSNHLPYHGFDIGDLVYIKQIPKMFNVAEDNEKFQLTAKLQHRYHGPHPVVAIVNPVSFEVNVNGKIKRVHANKMKRASPRPRTRNVAANLVDNANNDPAIIIPSDQEEFLDPTIVTAELNLLAPEASAPLPIPQGNVLPTIINQQANVLPPVMNRLHPNVGPGIRPLPNDPKTNCISSIT